MNNYNLKQEIKTKQILNIIGLLFMLLINFLANYLPLNDIPTDEISDKYYNIFTPAGFTFAIWGIIYLALIILVGSLTLGLIRNKTKSLRYIDKVGYLFFISSLLNAIWLFTWHYDLIGLSVIIMVGLLTTLILIYRRINFGVDNFGWLTIPFSIYLGWISVATIANISAWQVAIEWQRFGLSESAWLIVLLTVVILLTLIFLKIRKDYAYTLVILWALLGILAKLVESRGFIDLASLAVLISILIILFSGLKFAGGKISFN
ncbi:MAG: TspO/MBR family protein [Bacillota bacterium]